MKLTVQGMRYRNISFCDMLCDECYDCKEKPLVKPDVCAVCLSSRLCLARQENSELDLINRNLCARMG